MNHSTRPSALPACCCCRGSTDPVHFFDREYDQLHQNEKRTGKIMTLFSVIALFIASLGLLGLVSFTTEQRTKEIGIRKVQGASNQKILLHLWKDFGRWILISTLIAVPVTWYLMNNWLQNFAYRINFNWWSLAVSSIIAMVIAALTVSYQTLKAARINPAESLRYEKESMGLGVDVWVCALCG